jgi:microcystin-dependent protein
LTNEQVIVMVKAGMDDDTVAQAIRSAKAISFNLTAEGQKALTDGGASSAVLAAMKTRAAATHTTPAHTTTSHPAAIHAVGGNTAPK